MIFFFLNLNFSLFRQNNTDLADTSVKITPAPFSLQLLVLMIFLYYMSKSTTTQFRISQTWEDRDTAHECSHNVINVLLFVVRQYFSESFTSIHCREATKNVAL
jgi:hypothetical protein